jgi:riboflavin kinase/FMN adenylyltransferase
MPLGDRLAGLASCGMDATVVQRFTRDFAQVEAEEFVRRFLVEVLDAQKLVVGHDLNFGRNRAGSVETLVADGARHGFTVEVIRPVHVGSLVVHSSEIRRAVAAGDVTLAMRLLGRPHVVRGRVMHGAGRARGLGFPTANVRPKTQAVPPDGVYVTRAIAGKRCTGSVTSIGNAPTFGGGATVIEAHLLSDPGDLYGKPIAIEFLERLRDQQRFASPDALQRQVQTDIERARAILDREY